LVIRCDADKNVFRVSLSVLDEYIEIPIIIEHTMETPKIHAEMFIVVTYRPKWLLWYKSEKFPMKTEKTDNGTWIWKSIPR